MLGPLRAWLYKSGRPNWIARLLNRLWSRRAASGKGPEGLHSLEVCGRRSGRFISFPVVVADYEGERYLVAMLGHGANWVANVRAAGGHAVLRHGRREEIRLQEVEVGRRAPILRRCLQLAPGHAPISLSIHPPRWRFSRRSLPNTRSSLSDEIRLTAALSCFPCKAEPLLFVQSGDRGSPLSEQPRLLLSRQGRRAAVFDRSGRALRLLALG